MSNSNGKQPLEIESAQASSITIPTVKPREENDSFGVPGIYDQPDLTRGNISHSDKASTSTTIDVDESHDETIGFLLDCAERGQNSGNKRPLSICKASGVLRDHSESSFEPQLVSIGPIHRENKKLKEFEWLKECYLNDLLHRSHDSTPPRETLEACLQKVNTLLPQVRESYAADAIKNYSNSDLARMMVMDGCFILEFCFKENRGNLYLANTMQNNRIAMDLMLLENQVPFFVLQDLFHCSMGKESFTLSQVLDAYLAPYVMLFCSLLPENNPTKDVDSDSTHDHVLGYLHKRCQLIVAKSTSIPNFEEASQLVGEERTEHTAFHSIVELDRSGMNFKPHQKDDWSMTIKYRPSLFPCLPWFWGKPTLLMPTLVINDLTEQILRNFIAYEQLFPQDRYCFTSYAIAMDILINTQEDIAKLVESEVLVNRLGSNQEAADMINKICKNMINTDFCYTKEFKRMDKYYKSFWPKHIAWLRRVYFSNPWSIIALVAAIILFGLTVVQTIYTIRAA